jgi:hypothetical protein
MKDTLEILRYILEELFKSGVMVSNRFQELCSKVENKNENKEKLEILGDRKNDTLKYKCVTICDYVTNTLQRIICDERVFLIF